MPPKKPASDQKFLIASILQEIGQLLEVKGVDRFRAKAYRNAARHIADFPGDLATLAAQNRLTEIRGVGGTLAGQISEIIATGRSTFLEKLRSELPPGAIELSRVLSLKKLQKLHESLDIRNVEDLKSAIADGRINDVPGFGKKSAQQLLEAIERYENRGQRILLLHARRLAARIIEFTKSFPETIEAEAAGAVRRWKETVGTIRIVASTSAPERLLEYFLQLPSITLIEKQTKTTCTVRLVEDVQVSFFAVLPGEYPFALYAETGAPAHLEKMRAFVLKKGFHLTSTGLERLARPRTAKETKQTKRSVAAKLTTEADIFKQVGLQYITPELREGEDELELAAAGKLPSDLLTIADIKGMVHCHTTYSDGRNSIEEMALAAEAMGMQYITITDHSPTAFYANGVKIDRLMRQWDEIAQVQEQVKVKLLRGTESDILKEGALDYPDRILEQFDVIIASIHNRYQLNEEGMTRRVMGAMKNPYFKIWGHPLGRLVQRRPPIPLRVEEVLDVIADANAAIEINGDPHRLDLEPRWLKQARKRGIKFVVSTDAHSITDLQHLPFGIGLARRAGIPRSEVLNAMTVSRFRKHVRPR